MGRTRRKRKHQGHLKKEGKNINVSAQILQLLRWMKTAGKWRPECALQLTDFVRSSLRGFMTRKHIESNSLLVSIPFNLLITREVVKSFMRESKVFEVCDTERFEILSTHELLVIFLLLNKHLYKIKKSSSQFWKPYLDTMPESYEVPYFCKDDEVERID